MLRAEYEIYHFDCWYFRRNSLKYNVIIYELVSILIHSNYLILFVFILQHFCGCQFNGYPLAKKYFVNMRI